MRSTRQQVARAIVETVASLRAGAGFAARAAAIDSLDTHVLDRLRYLEERAGLPDELQALRARAVDLSRQLEAANQRFTRRIGGRIRSGRYTREGLRRALLSRAGPAGGRDGYDALDLLVEGPLNAGDPPEARAAPEAEMVGYQPAPARAILALIERAGMGPDDVFYDLGSGLGQVVIWVALLTGARTRGVEIEPAYCEYARRCARGLEVAGVEFLQADARDAPLAGGTVYFLYTPFRGAMLREVLARLEAEARRRPICVCAYGPCTAEIAGARWLKLRDGEVPGADAVAVFDSANPAQVRSWSRP